MKIAIIGGIGSGKSEVLSVARQMGVCCLSADEINAQLLQDPYYIAKIEQEFPTAVSNGKVNKASLSALVFRDKSKREKLNAIAHPRILERIDFEKADPLVVELPLIVESGAAGLFDEIVLVSAPICARLKRLINGRGMRAKSVISIMRVQVKERDLKKIATRMIKNNGSIENLRSSAELLLSHLCKN